MPIRRTLQRFREDRVPADKKGTPRWDKRLGWGTLHWKRCAKAWLQMQMQMKMAGKAPTNKAKMDPTPCFPLRLIGWMLVAGTAAAAAQSSATGRTYFEFGTVVGVGEKTVDVQTYDARRQRTVRHPFVLTRGVRADVVRPGDPVEVIYTVDGTEWRLERMLLLHGGVPQAGPPPGAREEAAGGAPIAPPPLAAPAIAAPAIAPPGIAPAGDRLATQPSGGSRLFAAPAPPAVRAASAVNLGSKAAPKVAAVTPVPLGIAAGYSSKPPVAKTWAVARETPAAECHQSDPEWASEPLSIAVLDFRYPTEREEAHDVGQASGGSGMAVGDLIYERLKGQREFAVDRGDRRRLDRSDIAGAARLGRELGVDAVLEGTFQPIVDPPAEDGFPGKLRGYSLHAGVVDTCTGQVLMKLNSSSCAAAGAEGGSATACEELSVSTRDAEDPEEHAKAFEAPIGALLAGLEHPAALGVAPAGRVEAVHGETVTLKMAEGAGGLATGDQLSVRATRLAKNPSTYTLQFFDGQEIGRVTVRSVRGTEVVGTYAGDVPARLGDAVERVHE